MGFFRYRTVIGLWSCGLLAQRWYLQFFEAIRCRRKLAFELSQVETSGPFVLGYKCDLRYNSLYDTRWDDETFFLVE